MYYFQVMVEFGGTFVYKLTVVVSDDCVGNTIAADDVLPNKALDLFSCYRGQRFCLDPLRELVYDDQKELDLPFPWRKWANYVHAPFGEWPWGGDVMELFFMHVCYRVGF